MLQYIPYDLLFQINLAGYNLLVPIDNVLLSIRYHGSKIAVITKKEEKIIFILFSSNTSNSTKYLVNLQKRYYKAAS